MPRKKVCAWCLESHKRRTKCSGCGAMLCQFDYMTHKEALENGDGCLFAMFAKVERNLGIRQHRGEQLTDQQFNAARNGEFDETQLVIMEANVLRY